MNKVTHFEFPWDDMVVRGKTPLGEKGEMGFLAWFKDSEGNILGLSQYKKAE